MPDNSFKVWHVAVTCDDPHHARGKLHPDDHAYRNPHFRDNDWESVEPDATRQSYRADMRAEGWIFHRDGRVTCPECAALAKDAK